ncbi:DNA cytosine methyltransferase [Pseudomonas viridiflava]|uniref:DNA cytosine methyltransferase n=1 Tax=Pseudomonas viridiflava TaxID=33069 RepID=UPI000F0379CC|nr:DNA cytosine methyltransferase [Pseudomonas viridiflava]
MLKESYPTICSLNDSVTERELSELNRIHKKINALDLFSGAGGLSLAAQRSGIDIVAAVELNSHACATYKHNLIKEEVPKLYNEDILKLSPELIKVNHFSGSDACDIILGGPPCQGFSVHRIKDSGVDDPRNNLVLRYFEYVKHLKPKVFLMENVPGILWPRHKKFLDALYRQAKKTGYKILEPELIDARDYGVPQRRRRIFILGVRKDVPLNIVWPPRPTHGDAKSIERDSSLSPWVNSEAVFNLAVSASDENNRHMNHSDELIEVFRRTPVNGSRKDSGRVLPCHDKHNGHKDVYGRINLMEPGPTMTTACINPSKGRFVHPIENHGITIRHAARFQTFPEGFVFKGGLTASGAQIGNAVPIRLGEVLLTSIASALREV